EDLPFVRITEPEADEPHEDTVELVLGDAATEHDDAADDDPLNESADGESQDLAEDEPSEEIVAVEESLEDPAEDDPEKLAVLPIVPIGVAATVSEDAPDVDGDEGVESDDDTGEIPIVGLGDAGTESQGASTVFDGEDFTEEHYLDAATREHHDLAAAIAAAEGQDTEQVALSAAIPGLDSGVVGFDDVVEGHGDETSVPIAPPKSSDLVLRVATGVGLIAAFLLSLLWRPAIIVLALAVFVIAAGEFYSVLMHRRYKPLSIFGFLGIVGAGLGAVVWGVIAIPLAFALMITIILLFDAVSQRRQGAVTGFSLTILVAVWIGGFGAFAFPIIAADNYQALVLTVVAMVALVDIAAYFVGRTIGRRPFAPQISPKKTIEGFIGGTLMALLAGAVASFFVEAIDLPAGLVLGVVVAIFAPLGDLSVSVIKRSLNIKDMGSILPGHGGLLDRIDAIIAVVPAAWATFVWLGLL
ncbi:MAG: phosphatidate cytidylyltransferase, partial [Actinomycetota bacterium]|nr:phosphatidate cytidylyltransferase [Actinomycetota bacterium]